MAKSVLGLEGTSRHNNFQSFQPRRKKNFLYILPFFRVKFRRNLGKKHIKEIKVGDLSTLFNDLQGPNLFKPWFKVWNSVDFGHLVSTLFCRNSLDFSLPIIFGEIGRSVVGFLKIISFSISTFSVSARVLWKFRIFKVLRVSAAVSAQLCLTPSRFEFKTR